MFVELGTILIGIAAAIGAAATLFLASPRSTRFKLRASVALPLCATFSAASVTALQTHFGLAESVYTAILVMMAVLTILPFLLAMLRRENSQ